MGPDSLAIQVRAEGVSKRFGARSVLTSITFVANPGETLVITGPNGSGKSTLIRIISGLLRPTEGQVTFSLNGQPLDRIHRRRHLGWVSPEYNLYNDLSGVENLVLCAQLHGIQPCRAELRSALDTVGLLGRGSDWVRTYSSGMKQRLKLACALIHNPLILLLDEPTANLDRSGAEMVERVIQYHRQRGITILATNEPEELKWGDRVVRVDAA